MRISLSRKEALLLRDTLIWVHQLKMDAAKGFEDRMVESPWCAQTVEASRQAALDEALEVRKLGENLTAALDRKEGAGT